MQRWLGWIAILTFVAACAPMLAGQEAAATLRPDPAVRYGTLANGLRYAIVHNASPTKRGALRLRINAGWNSERPDQRGVAHLIEHLAFRGSARLPEGELVALLQRHGLAVGSGLNAYTSFDETVYSLDLPSATTDSVDAGLFALREIAGELTLADAAVDGERGVVLAEDRLQNADEQRKQLAHWRFLYPHAKFIDRLPGAKPDVVASVSAQRVKNFYQAWYRPENAFLLFAGDAPVAQVEQQIIEKFSGWQGRGPAGVALEMGHVERRGLEVGFVPSSQSSMALSLVSIQPAAARTDSAEVRFQQALLDVANTIVNQRLSELSMQPEPPFISASVSSQRTFDFADAQMLNVLASRQHWERALMSVEQELRRVLLHGFTAGEVALQVRDVRVSGEEGARSAASRLTEGYVFALMYAEREGRIFTHPADDERRFTDYARRITPQALHQAFVRAWGERDPLILVGSNEPPAAVETRAREVFEASKRWSVQPPREIEPVSFAYTDFGPPGKVVRRQHHAAADLTMVQFANNVRASIKRTPFESDRIRVQVRISGAAISEVGDAPGLNYAFGYAFLAGGLQAHDYAELQRTREGRTANLAVEGTFTGFNLYGETTPAALLYQLQLLTAYVTAPAFRPEPLQMYQQQVAQTYDSDADTPSGAWHSNNVRLLYSNHPRVGLPRKAELLAWTSDKLRSAASSALATGPIEIGIVGAVDPDAAIAQLAHTFGALPERKLVRAEVPSDRLATMPAGGGPAVIIRHNGDKSQAIVGAHWRTGDDRDVQRAAILDIAGRIVKARLVQRLREKDGASYSPQAFDVPSPYFKDFGYFAVIVDAPAAEVARVFGVIDQSVASLAAGVAQIEVDQASNRRLDQLRAEREDNFFWLGLAAHAQSDPAYVTRRLATPEAYRSISPDDVATAARRYLIPGQAYRIAVLPAEEGPKTLP